MLADHQIECSVQHGEPYQLTISGYEPRHLNPASYDLTLSPLIRRTRPGLIPDRTVLDVAEVASGYSRSEKMDEKGLVIGPGEFILAATNEVVGLPLELSARVEGKSSLGRIGLAVHITAGFIDPGFCGSITLEIANLLGRPIRLRPNMRIAQIAFTTMSARPTNGYAVTGHYQNQGIGEISEPVESRYKMADRVPQPEGA